MRLQLGTAPAPVPTSPEPSGRRRALDEAPADRQADAVAEPPPILPEPFRVFCGIVIASGYRSALENVGAVELLRADRHDSALSFREAFDDLEQRCRELLRPECGDTWVGVFSDCWDAHHRELQRAARTVDTRSIPRRSGRVAVGRAFADVLVVRWLLAAREMFDAPPLARWFEAPIGAWGAYLSARAGTSEREIHKWFEATFAVDRRTRERWTAGHAAPRGRVARLADVQALLHSAGARNLSIDIAQEATGWLTLAMAFQSIPAAGRRRLHAVHRAYNESADVITMLGSALETASAGSQSIPRGRGQHRAAGDDSVPDRSDRTHYSAMLAARSGEKKTATTHFRTALRLDWWQAGGTQAQLLDDALVVAVGLGDQVLARDCWSRLQLLGTIRWKQELDDVERQRLAVRFARDFAPASPEERLARLPWISSGDAPYRLTARDRKRPNALRHAKNGTTRWTVLMHACDSGTVDDIDMLLECGADPDGTSPDTGEGPLYVAFDRAQARGETDALYRLLEIDLSLKTVTRPCGPFQDTPLSLAIDIADTHAVRRLVALGAELEAPAGRAPTALVHALSCFTLTSTKGFAQMTDRYVRAEDGPDVYDAARGATTTADAARCRTRDVAAQLATESGRRRTELAHAKHIPTIAEYRRVIRVLLELEADPNARYASETDPGWQFTPTLLAAEIGDLPILQDLVSYGGDPELCLLENGIRTALDASAIAHAYGHAEVHRWLTKYRARIDRKP